MRHKQLLEGLIKVPDSLLELVAKEVVGLIYGRLINYLTIAKESYSDEEMDVFFEHEVEFVRNNNHLYTYSYDYLEKKFELEIELTKHDLYIEGYPKPVSDSIELLVDITCDTDAIGASIQFGKGFNFVKLNIDLRKHFHKLKGETAEGKEIYSSKLSNIKSDLKDIKALIKHELMHFVQYIYFNPQTNKGNVYKVNYYNKDKDGNINMNDVDFDKYFTSEVEFNPYLQSEIERFRKRYYIPDNLSLTYFNIQEFIGLPRKDEKPTGYTPVVVSDYFKTLRRKSPTKFKKAAKIFFDYIVHNKDYETVKINEDAQSDRAMYENANKAWNTLVRLILSNISNKKFQPFDATYGMLFREAENKQPFKVDNDNVLVYFVPKDKFVAQYKSEIDQEGKISEQHIYLGYTLDMHSEELMDIKDFIDLLEQEHKSAFIHEYTHKMDMYKTKDIKSYRKSISKQQLKGEYINTPSEFNAVFMQIYNDIKRADKFSKKPYHGHSFEEFLEFVKDNSYYYQVLEYDLNAQYKRTLLKRLLNLYNNDYKHDDRTE